MIRHADDRRIILSFYMDLKYLLGFLLCFLIGTRALHVHTAHNLVHLQTNEEKQAYLNSLLKIEQQLRDNVENLQKSVEDYNQKSQDFDGLETIQTQFLEDAIGVERDALLDMEKGFILPLGLKTWECKNITQEEVDAIHKEILSTQQKISELKLKLENQAPCLRNDEVLKQIEFLNTYLNHLLMQLANRCSSDISTNTFFVPNKEGLVSYGDGKTPQDYQQEVQDKLDDGFTPIECPYHTPYPGDGKCVGCPEEGQYYDLSTSTCLACPEGSHFDAESHQCLIIPLNSGADAQNYYGVKPSPKTGLDTCPESEPFFNGEQCEACRIPSYFDYNENKCEKCPEGQAFDLSTHLCGYIKFNSNINPEGGSNYCCGEVPHDNSLQTCPQASPFFNGKECISCTLPSYFSLSSSTCALCGLGRSFSLTSGKCIDSKYLEPYYESNTSPENQNYYGHEPQIDGNYEIIKKCPAEQPYFNGDKCISCSLPNYFNFNSGLCEVCQAGEKFDTNIKKCIHISTEKKNSNMVVIDNFKGKVPVYNRSLTTCDEETPFFDGTQCIQCQYPKYVDFGVQECEQCSGQGMIFDLFHRDCVKKDQQYYTDPQAKNIFYNGDWSEVEKRIKEKKAQNPSMQKCSNPHPYYNAVRGQCMSCPSEYPLFDYKYNRCIACTGDSSYNEERRICVLPGSVKATIERMMMNTISWI